MSKQSSRGGDWERIRKTILERDNGVCAYGCGREATQVDHLIPKAAGGTDDEWNLVAACHLCNARKGAKVVIPINYVNRKWLTSL